MQNNLRKYAKEKNKNNTSFIVHNPPPPPLLIKKKRRKENCIGKHLFYMNRSLFFF